MRNVPAATRGSAVLLGTACLLFASVSWGMNVPLTAVLFRTFDPFFLSPLRVAIASMVLGAIMLATLGARSLAMPTSAGRLAATSLAMAAFFVLYNVGLRYTDTITAAAITAGSPVYAAITLRLLTRAPLERGFWAAAAMTLVGAGIAIWGRSGDSGGGLTLQGGEPLLVLSLVSWTLYSILAQRWFDPSVPQLRRTFAATLCTVAWLAVFWGLLRAAGLVGPPPTSPGAEAITYLMITAVFATALGGFAWNIGVNRMGVAASSLWQNTVPVFAVLVSMLFGMVPTVEQIVGGTIVLAGVLYMQWHKVRPPRP